MNKQCKSKNIYTIPYNEIPYGSKVAIYGAGKAGEYYARNILFTNRYNLIGMIDRNPAKAMFGVDIKIYLPEEVADLDVDYILIAVEKRDIAFEIKEKLIDYGIDESRIVWNGDENENPQLIETQEYQKFLERNFSCSMRKIFLFMLPEHSNTGDYAIGHAEEKFIKKYFPGYKLVTVTTLEWVFARESIIKHVHPDDLIFLNGGGYIGDLWDDTPNYQSIVEAFPDNIKFFFPNTLTYKCRPNEAYKPFVDEMTWFKKQKKLYTMFRDEYSYQRFKAYNDRAFYFPDMVLFSHYERKNDCNGSKVLLCFRGDKEKIFDKADRLKQMLKDNNFEIDEMDIYGARYVSQQSGYALVDAITNKMQEYACVLTDRLHGMLLATVSDVPCIAFDNFTHKVEGVYAWIKDIKSVKCSCDGDINNIIDDIHYVTNTEKNTFEPLNNEFEKMAQTIISIIEVN